MKFIKLILFFVIFCNCNFSSIYAQEFKAKNLIIEWKDDNKILITYDLSSPEDSEVEVKIFMMSNNDKNMKVEVHTASGNIGIGKYSGKGNKVVWEIYEDYPNIEEDQSYYFTLEANVIGDNSGWPWYYYFGGGAVVGVAVYLLSGSPVSEPPQTETGFPSPPLRK